MLVLLELVEEVVCDEHSHLNNARDYNQVIIITVLFTMKILTKDLKHLNHHKSVEIKTKKLSF